MIEPHNAKPILTFPELGSHVHGLRALPVFAHRDAFTIQVGFKFIVAGEEELSRNRRTF
jgi:hypothetical protein